MQDSEELWGLAPTDLLLQVAELLSCHDLQTARLVCKGWNEAVSQAVKVLAPNMQANALGLQWSQLSKLQAAFPMVQELNLQQNPPSAAEAQYFASLASLQRIKLSSILRTEEPNDLIKEIHDFALGIQLSNPGAIIEVELRFGMPFSEQQTKICIGLTQLPSNIAITNFNIPQQSGVWSTRCLHMLLSLHTLQSLHLVQYGGLRVSNEDFSMIAALKQLQSLAFGLTTHVQDCGIVAGLQGLGHLQRLALYDVSSITDKCLLALTPKLLALEFLSLSKCSGLTNTSLDSLSKMPALVKLFLTENDQITDSYAQSFRTGSRLLHVRHCPNIQNYDVMI